MMYSLIPLLPLFIAPQTGDDTMTYVIIAAVVIILLILLFLFIPKNRR